MSEQVSSKFSAEDLDELRVYISDTLELLVNDPDSLKVVTSVEEDERGKAIRVSFTGPKSEVAMIVGRKGSTVQALHRVFFSVARRMGFVGSLHLDWLGQD